MPRQTGMTVHLDQDCVAALTQLKRQIDASNETDALPAFTLPELARHAIRKWCDQQAAPVGTTSAIKAEA